MRITIDNNDGLGAVDFSAALLSSSRLKLHRKLNEPTECIFWLDCNAPGLSLPVRFGRIVLSSEAGSVLFTGYILPSPATEFAGVSMAGKLFHLKVTATSDEALLNQESVPVTAGSSGVLATSLIQALTLRVDAVKLPVNQSSIKNAVGYFVADPAHTWSQNAGHLASESRLTYQAINGQLTLQPIGTAIHALSASDGTLELSNFSVSQSRMFANDFTVCGEAEAQVYVTEVFQGDGTTTTFELAREPMEVAPIASSFIQDSFAGPAINSILWQTNDPSSRFSLSPAGLSISGGNGLDGQSTLSTIDNIELGGSIVMAADGVQVSQNSDGYIACFYSGATLIQNLFAGFHVKSSNGTSIVRPVINSVDTGSSYTLTSGRSYTFRLRYHAPEMQRVLSTYYVTGSGTQQSFGGGLITSAASLVFEIQDTTGGLVQPTNVLYDGSVANAPSTCTPAVVNTLALTGSIQTFSVTRKGTPWVTSLQTGGSMFTRRLGAATTGADCRVTAAGTLEFYPTRIPQNGELITSTYRTAGTAVARLKNTHVSGASGQVAQGVSRWIGSVSKPAARSSADCENAALALIAVSSSPTSGWSGKYTAVNVQQTADVWPGDILAISSSAQGVSANLIVRAVTITNEPTYPELLTYSIQFADEWAEELSVKTTKTVPKTAWLPQTALTQPVALACLSQLTIAVSTLQINVTAGTVAPAGGGFEVRRVDWNFGPGSDGSLVLRSPLPNFTILREAAIEQYFVRMYDGSTPPNYSRFSNEICISVPL